MEFLDVSPCKLLTEHRLNNAGNDLLSGAFSVKEIAKLTGYADEFSFSRAFRKFFGVPPSVYAAMKRGKNAVREDPGSRNGDAVQALTRRTRP